ncbi:MAG: FhaA domain-containing protein [Segniliparus sp.]|uniref:FhaA domain-containing protein n=1 Tax=Segniliparus sp. TaxID=2804064 RepID=UPI003F313E04
MGMVQRIERTLEGAIGDAFARVFGGNLQVSEVQAGLQREAAMGVRTGSDGQPVTSDQYTIRLGQADVEHLEEHYDEVTKVLTRHLEQFIAAQGWTVRRPVSVRLEASDQMRQGQLRISSSADSAAGAGPAGASSGSGPSAPAPAPSHRQNVRRVLRLTEGSGRQHQLAHGVSVLGRGATAQVQLDDKAVSREHCRIWWDGQRAVLQDLGSTNGTSVNGERVSEWQLADGDVINLGQSLVIVRFG